MICALKTQIVGTLHDGRQFQGRMATLGGSDDGLGGDPQLGTELEGGEGWWVKGQVAGVDGEVSYLQCQGTGRKVQYRDVPAKHAVVGQRAAKRTKL